ncbi:hypothetical protein B7494_g6060 [Chlorociboria aeruginascens]|nr:hypothetical protein B7494_g6060 [Chlorociboria aeruginascens]
MARYGDDPVWSDVVPLAQDDGAGALAAISYTDEYSEAMGYLRAIMASQEHSTRVLELTDHIISMNAAHYTVWLYRASTIFALSSPIEKELAWLNDVALDNPKNYQIWHHRHLLIDTLYPLISSDPKSIAALAKSEIAFMTKMFDEDSKNYHVWSYRQYLVRKLDLFHDDEIKSIETLLRRDIRNNSAWAHRFFIVFSNPSYSTPSKATEHDPKIPDEILDREIEYATSSTYKAPQNQSPWNYLRGVLRKGGRELGTLESFATQFVKISGGEDTVKSSHALDFLADVWAEQGKIREADDALKLLGDKSNRQRSSSLVALLQNNVSSASTLSPLRINLSSNISSLSLRTTFGIFTPSVPQPKVSSMFYDLVHLPDPRPSKAHPDHRAHRKEIEKDAAFDTKEIGIKGGLLLMLGLIACFPWEKKWVEGKMEEHDLEHHPERRPRGHREREELEERYREEKERRRRRRERERRRDRRDREDREDRERRDDGWEEDEDEDGNKRNDKWDRQDSVKPRAKEYHLLTLPRCISTWRELTWAVMARYRYSPSILLPPKNTYLIDIYSLGRAAFSTTNNSRTSLKTTLESSTIPKVVFDIRNDSDALFSLFQISINGIKDLQLMELAYRTGSREFVSGLAKCVEKDSPISAAAKTEWSLTKKRYHRLFAPEQGGRYEVFNERPLKPEIIECCKWNVVLLPGLYNVYNTKLRQPGLAFWRVHVRETIKDWIKLSQSSGYDGKSKSNALGWNDDTIEKGIESWNEDILMEASLGDWILNENDEWVPAPKDDLEFHLDRYFDEEEEEQDYNDWYPDTARDCIGWEEDMIKNGELF